MTTVVRRVSPMSSGGVYRYVPRTGLWIRLTTREIRDGYETYRRETGDTNRKRYRDSIRRRIEFDRPVVRRDLFVMARRVYDTVQRRLRVASPDMYLLRCTDWSYSVDLADRCEASLVRRLNDWFPHADTRRWVLNWFGQLLHGRRAPERQFVLWLMTDDVRLPRLLIRTFDRYAHDDIPPPCNAARSLMHKRLLIVDHESRSRKLHERNLRRILNCEDERMECGLCVISSLPPVPRRPLITDPWIKRRIAACRAKRKKENNDDDNDDSSEEGMIHAFFRRLIEACHRDESFDEIPSSMSYETELHVLLC